MPFSFNTQSTLGRWRLFAILGLILVSMGVSSLAEAAPPEPNPWGVQILREIGPGEGISQAEAAGVRWIRYPLNWRRTEIAPGYYDWSQLDKDLAQAAQRNMRLLIYVVANPEWAGVKSCGPIYEHRLDEFARFLETAAARVRNAYPGIAPYWALYNEPDISDSGVDFGGCWGTGHPRSLANAGGAAYARMMEVASPAIKRGDPDAVVTNGALAYDDWYNPATGRGRVDAKFLDQFLAAGGGKWVDAVDFHYYPAFAGNWRSTDRYASNIVGKGNAILAKFRAYGFDPPLIVSETGFPTRAETPSDTEWPARYVAQAFARAMSAQVYPIVWFLLVDYPYSIDPYYYGLVTRTFQPKQAFYAYQTLTRELDGFTFLRTRPGLAAILEGYDFRKGGQTSTVIWSLQSQPVQHRFALAATGGVLRKVTHLGAVSQITDGMAGDGDGERNGQVQIAIGPDPIYVQGLAVELGGIAGKVFHDLNQNAVRDAGEPALDGAILNLHDELGYLIYQISTGPDGSFHFDELEPGRYRIHAAPPPGFSFELGQHWVTVAGGSTPTQIDLAATERSTATALWQSEAEGGILASPMTVLPDAGASGGQYVSSPYTNYDPNADNGGSVAFEFNVETAKAFYVWARVMGLDGQHNSFWVSMDGGARSILEIQTVDGQWAWGWQRLSAVPYALTAGNHTLRFSAREADARLDRVILADDAGYHPLATPTPTPSPTATATETPSATSTSTATPTPSATWSPTATPTATPSPSPTATATATFTPTETPTPTLAPSATPTPSPTATATETPSATPTSTATPTPSETPTPTPSPTATPSPTSTPTPAPGGISGQVFHDQNHNLIQDEDEPGIGDVKVELFPEHGKSIKSLSDADGRFRFGELAAGPYIVVEYRPPGWGAAKPSDTLHVLVTSGFELQIGFAHQPEPTTTPTSSPTSVPRLYLPLLLSR